MSGAAMMGSGGTPNSVTVGYYNYTGSPNITEWGYGPSIGSISGSAVGFTILSLMWSNVNGSISLILNVTGNGGTGVRHTTINGISFGASNAGVYTAGSNSTEWVWPAPASNPFSPTVGAHIPFTIS